MQFRSPRWSWRAWACMLKKGPTSRIKLWRTFWSRWKNLRMARIFCSASFFVLILVWLCLPPSPSTTLSPTSLFFFPLPFPLPLAHLSLLFSSPTLLASYSPRPLSPLPILHFSFSRTAPSTSNWSHSAPPPRFWQCVEAATYGTRNGYCWRRINRMGIARRNGTISGGRKRSIGVE